MLSQVRKYEPFIVVERSADKLTGSAGFNDVTGLVYLQDFMPPIFVSMHDISKWILFEQVYFWKEFKGGEDTDDDSSLH